MRADIPEQAQAIRESMDAAANVLTDEQAAAAPFLYPRWVMGAAVAAGDRRYYVPTERLYKCVAAHTTQADWTPDITPALWAVLDATHAGTQQDPIPAARGMEYSYGLYYLDGEDGKLYLCQRQGESGSIVLQYLPHELEGIYFVEVSG